MGLNLILQSWILCFLNIYRLRLLFPGGSAGSNTLGADAAVLLTPRVRLLPETLQISELILSTIGLRSNTSARQLDLGRIDVANEIANAKMHDKAIRSCSPKPP